MTTKDLVARVSELLSNPLVLLCKTQDGKVQEMGIEKCIETKSGFIQIVLDELDALLDRELNGGDGT